MIMLQTKKHLNNPLDLSLQLISISCNIICGTNVPYVQVHIKHLDDFELYIPMIPQF